MASENRSPRRDRTAGGVDVHIDFALGILGFEEQELRGNEIGYLVVDLTEEDDAVLQQPRVDVIGALAAPGLLHHEWNQDAHGLRVLPAAEVGRFSISGAMGANRSRE